MLRAVKTFGVGPGDSTAMFPTTRAAMRTHLAKHVPDPVGHAVVLRAQIDLSSVGMDLVSFDFIDPIWVWIQQACKVGSSCKLWFECRAALNAGGKKMYGGGVQFGDAVSACSDGEVPALIAIHFDKGMLGMVGNTCS